MATGDAAAEWLHEELGEAAGRGLLIVLRARGSFNSPFNAMQNRSQKNPKECSARCGTSGRMAEKDSSEATEVRW